MNRYPDHSDIAPQRKAKSNRFVRIHVQRPHAGRLLPRATQHLFSDDIGDEEIITTPSPSTRGEGRGEGSSDVQSTCDGRLMFRVIKTVRMAWTDRHHLMNSFVSLRLLRAFVSNDLDLP
jgi:hypothetical protein